MRERYNVSVRTEIWRSDGRLFCDLGTMRWPGVDEEIVAWLAGSCKTTAFWLIGLPEAAGPDTFTLKYQTIVTKGDGAPHSDTTELAFERMTYADVVRFEKWALDQLRELCDLFAARKAAAPSAPTRRRSKVGQLVRWTISIIKAKCFR